MKQLSGLVMTYNEEANLDRCLKSMEGIADEVLVVDSESTDRTVDIARSYGARIIVRPYPGFKEQRTFMIEAATFDQVLVLDADEEISPELRSSILSAKAHWPSDCYWCNRLSRIGDHWIRHGAYYPDRKMRLFDRRKYVHAGINPHDKPVPAPGASASHLAGDLLHHAYTDLSERAEKMNSLSTHAAQAYLELGKRGSLFRILLKPTFRFLIEYVLRGGFLDGFYGFAIARTSAVYVFLREAKLMELQRKENKPPDIP